VSLLKRLKPRSHGPALVRASRDPDAFAEFYEQYAERVLIFMTRRVFDVELAFDLTSETFALALERSEQFRGSTAEEEQGWLFAIARNLLGEYMRRGKVEREAARRLSAEPPPISTSTTEMIERAAGLADLRAQLREALDELPADQRQAVQLRVVDELSYSEVAARAETSEQVVRARVSRGLRTLGQRLSADSSSLTEAV
jgi:RNA polymerase sigma-70 factor (ECF subfamily)